MEKLGRAKTIKNSQHSLNVKKKQNKNKKKKAKINEQINNNNNGYLLLYDG